MRDYRVDDLFDSYLRAVGRPDYGLEAYRAWHAHVLDCMTRCFGVSFQVAEAAPLRAVLEQEAHLPHPVDGFLDASLLYRWFEPALTRLSDRQRALVALYRAHATSLALELWGELGVRTTEQLRAAGWDVTREPNLDDYLDQI